MASERQLAANRRNGSKGGPKTDAGKHHSRLNSLKHGLTSSTLVVLPDEYQHEYDQVLTGFRESLQPADSVEEALVLRLAQAHWRSLRARRIESGMLAVTADVQRHTARELVEHCPEHLNVHNAIGVAFLRMPPEQWQTYLRYDTTISRDFFRTLDTLTKLQRMRQTKPPALAMAAGQAVSPAILTTPLSDSGIRSVSQNEQQQQSPNPAPKPAVSSNAFDIAHRNHGACSHVVKTSGQMINGICFNPYAISDPGHRRVAAQSELCNTIHYACFL